MVEPTTDGDVSPDVDEIVESLNSIQRSGHSYYQVFRDWIDLMLYALQRDDDQYLAVMERYDNDAPRGEREADDFARAFGELQKQTAATGLDVLGDVYEEFGMQSDQLGQHFTPHAVADLLAELQTGSDGPVEKISDPACGSGRLLLHTGKRYPDAFYVGQDRDAVCAKMTALNLCLFNLEGYVIHGDTLTMEHRNAWRTVSTSGGGAVHEVTADKAEASVPPVQQ